MPHPAEDPYHTPPDPRPRRPAHMSAVEKAMAVLQDAIQDQDARAPPPGKYKIDTNELNARLQAYKWEQDTPRSPCTPRTPASPMPPSAARSRHSAPPERGLASPFRTRGHSRHPTSPPSPTTDVSYLRGGGDTLGPYDSISAYHPPRRGGTNQDGDSDTERPRSRQSRHTRRPSRSATPVPQSYTSRAAMTPTKPRSRSRSRSRSSSPTPSGHEKFEHPGRSTDPTDEAEYEAEYEPHGLQFRSMKAHRAALLAAQHRRAERVVDAQDARDADQAAAVAEQLRNSLQLAQSNDRLQAAEAAVRDLQARLVVEKLRTGQVERRAAEAEAKRAADKAELAVAVSILRRVKDDKRRTEEERRRALRAFEEAKSRLVRYHEEIRVRDARRVGHQEGRTEAFEEAGRWMGNNPPLPLAQYTTDPGRGAVSVPNDFSLSPLGVHASTLPSFGSAAQQFQQYVRAIPQPQPQAAAPAFQQPPQTMPPPLQPQPAPIQPQVLHQPPLQPSPQPQAAAQVQPQPIAATTNGRTQVPITPSQPPTQCAPAQPSYATQRSITPQVYPALAHVPSPHIPSSRLHPVPVPVATVPARSQRSAGSVDPYAVPLPTSQTSQCTSRQRHVAESFLDRCEGGTPIPRVPPAPSQASQRPFPTHRSQHSVVEVNKPLPDPARTHTRSVSHPIELTAASVLGSRGPHKDSKYPVWHGSDPNYDDFDVMALKAFKEQAERVKRSFAGGSDDLAAAAAVQLPPSDSEPSAVPSRRAPSRSMNIRDDLSRISEEPRTPARSVGPSAPSPARSPHPIPALGISVGGAAPELSDRNYHRPPTITVQPPSSTKTPLDSRRVSNASGVRSSMPSPVPAQAQRSRAPSPAPRAPTVPTRGPSPAPSPSPSPSRRSQSQPESAYVRSAPIPASVYANSVAQAAGVPLPSSHGTTYTAPQHPRPRTPGASYVTATIYGHDRPVPSNQSQRTAVESCSDEERPRPRSILKNRGETPLIDPRAIPLPASRNTTYAPSASTLGGARRVPLPPSAGTRYSSYR